MHNYAFISVLPPENKCVLQTGAVVFLGSFVIFAYFMAAIDFSLCLEWERLRLQPETTLLDATKYYTEVRIFLLK